MIKSAFVVPHPPLIVPAVGRGEEKAIQKTIDSYTECAKRIAALKPQTIIVTSPHALCYTDYFHISPGKNANGSFARFRAGQEKISVEYDEELTQKISSLCAEQNFRAGTMGERFDSRELDHGTMVPLYFVNQFYTDYKLVRIGLSGLSFKTHWQFGAIIRAAIEAVGRSCVFIASGDLSHKLKDDGPYGFDPNGPLYDERVMNDLGTGDFAALMEYDENFIEQAAQCGHRSFLIMGGALQESNFKAERLSYEGPFGVGYGVCAYGHARFNF